MTAEAYPLQWPTGRARTERWRREPAPFDVTFARARDDIVREVELLTGTRHYGDAYVVISTNTALARDGLPLAGQRQPDDPGVAVYFTYKKRQMSFACDRWTKIEDNMRAISKTIEALRSIARWGTGDMLEAAFTGFEALPAPGAVRAWWEVLGVARHATKDEITQAYRRAAMDAHPDRGGSHDRMAELTRARDEGMRDK
ncbi:J domain-containing protein [Variovorax ureilyticus]|uniref:J domain-containing protein n=1 Tax=Variovorax ureilyticus TaxID=1836198 RepID=UPI003D67EA2B